MIPLRSRECCRFALLVLLVCAAWVPGFAEDRNYLEQFKKEYPPAVEKMRQVYSELKIVSELTTEPNNGRGEYTYLSGKGFYRLDYAWIGSSRDHETSVVYGPGGSFVLDRKRGRSDYSLRSLGQTTRRSEPTCDSISKISPINFAPFQYQSATIKTRMTEPDFVIDSALTRSDNANHVIVSWHWGNEAPRTLGQWIFDKSNSWALVSYKVRGEAIDGWRPEVQAQLEYEGQHNGVPLIKSLVVWAEDEKTGKVLEKQSALVKVIEPCHTDAEQFKLAAYKIHVEQGPPPSRTGRWLVVFGVAGISIAALLKFVVSSRRN